MSYRPETRTISRPDNGQITAKVNRPRSGGEEQVIMDTIKLKSIITKKNEHLEHQALNEAESLIEQYCS